MKFKFTSALRTTKQSVIALRSPLFAFRLRSVEHLFPFSKLDLRSPHMLIERFISLSVGGLGNENLTIWNCMQVHLSFKFENAIASGAPGWKWKTKVLRLFDKYANILYLVSMSRVERRDKIKSGAGDGRRRRTYFYSCRIMGTRRARIYRIRS